MDSSKEINPSDQNAGKSDAADAGSDKLSTAGEAAGNAASSEANAAEAASVQGSAAHSEPTPDAAKGAAEIKKPGSSLILLSPVTRDTDGTQADAPHMAKDGAASSFTAARASSRQNRNWMKYGIPAALAFCLFGFGVATGGQFFGAAAPSHSATAAITAPKPIHAAYANQAEVHRLSKKFGEQIHALQTRVEGLRVAAKASSSDEVREMKKSLDALRASIDSIKTQTNSSIAQLGAKVERLQREQAKLQKPNERVSRNEHVDSATTTGSIARAATSHVKVASAQTSTASSKNHQAATAAMQPKKAPKLLVDWVVRDVYRGVALIEGPQGTFEVARGDPIPGAGRVESIERKNGGWILVTSRGIVGSVRD
ncbi:MAG: hypothetical protein EPN75_01375 [Beijerinckiaceae bacterium]|nr:MAG: hypothetical protein EPN75_01375 [Beijerinckiaceae bacterium]